MTATVEASLEARLRDLLDRDEIWQVMQRYARGLDRLDNEMVLSCYWPDAIEDHNHFVGTPPDFVKFADAATLSFVTCQHGLANHVCELAGDDGYAETYFIFTGTRLPPPHFLSTGRYVDHFQRREGANGPEWRIANRVTVVEGTFDLTPSAMTAAMPSPYGAGETSPATRDRTDVSYHRPPVPRRPRQG